MVKRDNEQPYDDDNMRRPEREDDYEEEVTESEEEIEPHFQSHSSGAESIISKPTIDTFFDTEQLLQEIEKTMKGYEKVSGEWRYTSTPKARPSFINSMLNRLRSVINQQNMISYVTEDESKFLLMEKNLDFIYSVYDEPSIEDEDVESIINIFDHSLQLFMGQVVLGFGARTLRQISASVSYEVPKEQQDNSLFSIGYGNKNVVKFGGNNK